MFADDLPLRHDDKTIRIDPKADAMVGEGRRHAVAVAVEMYEAGRRDAFAALDKAIERRAWRH